ncbi:hypothetical protein KFE25_001429 [Diacronema lutheri]|uniref:Uncharacterized protein n=1 Tax=Diacronema lutheri TaxID=2081491 RepID=A0A8J6C8D3_DIALT|nr:hypothetical protein KFE25_001429 [Diacronema lutheri]
MAARLLRRAFPASERVQRARTAPLGESDGVLVELERLRAASWHAGRAAAGLRGDASKADAYVSLPANQPRAALGSCAGAVGPARAAASSGRSLGSGTPERTHDWTVDPGGRVCPPHGH